MAARPKMAANREFNAASELADVSADELARMVLDPSDPTRIRLDHSAFKHGQEHWDKILTSSHFKNVSKTELFRLFAMAS